MTISEPRNNGTNRRRRTLIAGAFVAAVALAAAATATVNANAQETWYDQGQLMTSCAQDVPGLGKADRCTFEPSGRKTYTGTRETVSSVFFNCTTAPLTQNMSWSQTVGWKQSIQVEVSATAGIEAVLSAGIKLTYQEEFSESSAETETASISIPVGFKGWYDRAPSMQDVSGRMSINYPKQRYGHYLWFAYPTVTSGVPGGNMSQVWVVTAPMSDTEKAQCTSTPGATFIEAGKDHVTTAGAQEETSGGGQATTEGSFEPGPAFGS